MPHTQPNEFASVSAIYKQQQIPDFFEMSSTSDQWSAALPAVTPKKKPADLPVTDPVAFYLRKIGEIPLLTPEEEQNLAKQMLQGREAAVRLREKKGSLSENERERLRIMVKTGDCAKEKLTNANLRLVIAVAKKFRNCGLPFPDLIQEGNIGLLKAVEKYDPAQETRFSTCAVWWIRAAVRRAVERHGRTIRIPSYKMRDVYRVSLVRSRLAQKLHQEPTTEDIAAEMQLPVNKVRDLLDLAAVPLSLEASIGDGDRKSCLGDLIADDDSLEETVQKNLRDEKIEQVLQTLTDQEATVIRMRFGVGYGRTHTLAEVGAVFHVTRERIRQIENRALKKLRRPSCTKKLYGLLD